ncbi:MAG: ABC transporter substrate-binding protein, partial [Gammaproteobacteria bacterium]|nr:ABC transporter substrate-binding protein [Gammaproteobacteria bacterium]
MWNPLPCFNLNKFFIATGRLLCRFCVLFLLAGCGEQQHASVRFGLNTAPITLDPRFVTDAVSSRICRLLYRRLVDFDDHYQAVPALAEWQVISSTHYRFRLGSRGREFHNGTRLDAGDVKATFDFILDNNNASPHRGTLTQIAAIRVLDDDTLDFHLNRPDLLFP